jgi:crotonobetainyl-CoA:carnitine CoA-transferase CaiB-like acyl-CoA transferase
MALAGQAMALAGQAMAPAGQAAPGPLAGTRVLDLTRLLPGPFASLVLGDLGAQVDKIEDTGPGDYLRVTPPLVGDTSAAFLALNRNKRSACLDLKKERGRAALLALAGHYDVLFEQFRPGVLERLGVGHDRLMAHNPRLVVCSLTGYGQTGPMAKRAGHDLNYLARSGVLGMQGPPGAPPQLPGFQLADIGSGLWCVIGILAALQERGRTGKGRVVDVSMVEASMGFAMVGFGSLFGGRVPVRGAEPLTGGLAMYGTYATGDGRSVALGALEPKFWGAFCAGVGIEAEPSAHFPGPHQEPLRERLRVLFASRTRDEWEAFGREHDCCLEPVLEPQELRDDEHLKARGVFFEMDSPWGKIQQLATPLADRGRDHSAPPRRGEHTDAILREAGLDDATIAAMKAEGSAQ